MNMFYYKTQIQYDGTGYAGFQWQHDLQTIQSEINNTLGKILPGKFSTTAASRTDSGVHALFQVLKITCENEINTETFLDLFNGELPAQIRASHLQISNGSFRPSTETSYKEYRYFFTNQTIVSREDSRFISNISNKLDIELIQSCVDELKGQHDFCNFYSQGSNVTSTVREIILCELKVVNPHNVITNNDIFVFPENIQSCYQIKIQARGFLKQMIRHIVSALWMVGSGKMSKEEFIVLLKGPKSDKQNWKVAPPNGLFLFHISYSSNA